MAWTEIDPREDCPDCEHCAYHHEHLSGCDVEMGNDWPPVYCPCGRIWARGAWFVREEEDPEGADYDAAQLFYHMEGWHRYWPYEQRPEWLRVKYP